MKLYRIHVSEEYLARSRWKDAERFITKVQINTWIGQNGIEPVLTDMYDEKDALLIKLRFNDKISVVEV